VREAHTLDDLYRIAEDFKRIKIEVLGISGGDGTNHVTLTGFINVYAGHQLPQIAFLRGGTMNTVANAVGVRRGRPEGLLGRLIRAYAERASFPLIHAERHVMRVVALDRRKNPGADHYGFLFGTGVVRGFLAEYYRSGEPSPLIAAKTLLRGVGSTMVRGDMIKRMAAPFRGSVEIDDGTRWAERDYLAIASGTIDQIGLNFRPFCRYAERPETFHILGIHASPLQLVRDLPRIWRAEPIRSRNAYEATPRWVRISSHDGAIGYMIDGDLHEARGPIELRVGPRVKIVVNL